LLSGGSGHPVATMYADTGRRLATLSVCVPLVATLGVACGGRSEPTTAECVKIVTESGEKSDQCLSVAPDSERIDLATHQEIFGPMRRVTARQLIRLVAGVDVTDTRRAGPRRTELG